MTANEMYDNFLLQYDVNGSSAAAGFIEEEVFSFLNKAQLELVSEVFLTTGSAPLEVLVSQLTTKMLNVQDINYWAVDDYETVGLDDYLYYITSRSLVKRTVHPVIATAIWIENDPIEVKNKNKYLVSDLNKPLFYRPKFFQTESLITPNIPTLNVITDSYCTLDITVNNFVLLYLRKPMILEVDGECELNEKWHQEIVNKAVLNALVITDDNRIKGAPQPKNQ